MLLHLFQSLINDCLSLFISRCCLRKVFIDLVSLFGWVVYHSLNFFLQLGNDLLRVIGVTHLIDHILDDSLSCWNATDFFCKVSDDLLHHGVLFVRILDFCLREGKHLSKFFILLNTIQSTGRFNRRDIVFIGVSFLFFLILDRFRESILDRRGGRNGFGEKIFVLFLISVVNLCVCTVLIVCQIDCFFILLVAVVRSRGTLGSFRLSDLSLFLLFLERVHDCHVLGKWLCRYDWCTLGGGLLFLNISNGSSECGLRGSLFGFRLGQQLCGRGTGGPLERDRGSL